MNDITFQFISTLKAQAIDAVHVDFPVFSAHFQQRQLVTKHLGSVYMPTPQNVVFDLVAEFLKFISKDQTVYVLGVSKTMGVDNNLEPTTGFIVRYGVVPQN